jgi:hypothetical protein
MIFKFSLLFFFGILSHSRFWVFEILSFSRFWVFRDFESFEILSFSKFWVIRDFELSGFWVFRDFKSFEILSFSRFWAFEILIFEILLQNRFSTNRTFDPSLRFFTFGRLRGLRKPLNWSQILVTSFEHLKRI